MDRFWNVDLSQGKLIDVEALLMSKEGISNDEEEALSPSPPPDEAMDGDSNAELNSMEEEVELSRDPDAPSSGDLGRRLLVDVIKRYERIGHGYAVGQWNSAARTSFI